MKRLLNISLAAVALLAFTSCEKCRTCTSSVTIGTANTADVILEQCDKKKELDTWEDAQKEAQQNNAKALGGTLNWSCVDE